MISIDIKDPWNGSKNISQKKSIVKIKISPILLTTTHLRLLIEVKIWHMYIFIIFPLYQFVKICVILIVIHKWGMDRASNKLNPRERFLI